MSQIQNEAQQTAESIVRFLDQVANWNLDAQAGHPDCVSRKAVKEKAERIWEDLNSWTARKDAGYDKLAEVLINLGKIK